MTMSVEHSQRTSSDPSSVQRVVVPGASSPRTESDTSVRREPTPVVSSPPRRSPVIKNRRKVVPKWLLVQNMFFKSAQLIMTLLAFVAYVVPSPSLTTEYFYCGRIPADNCFRVMYFPIGFSVLMIAVIASLLAFSCYRKMWPYLECGVSSTACILWALAIIISMESSIRFLSEEGPEKVMKHKVVDPTISWFIASGCGVIVAVIHAVDSIAIFRGIMQLRSKSNREKLKRDEQMSPRDRYGRDRNRSPDQKSVKMRSSDSSSRKGTNESVSRKQRNMSSSRTVAPNLSSRITPPRM